MKILGIDTSTMTGSIGLLDDERPLAEYTLNIEVTHSERLMEALDTLIKDARLGLDEVDGFAVAIGPGSFTGLRIGLAAVKGFCMSTGKPAAAVSTLEALAMNMPFCHHVICPVLDARKKEVYTALFRSDENNNIIRLMEDCVISPEKLTGLIQESVVFLGDGVYTYRDYFERTLGKSAHFAPAHSRLPSGLAVARIGLDKLRAGEIIHELQVPVYIRRSEAEIKLEVKSRRV